MDPKVIELLTEPRGAAIHSEYLAATGSGIIPGMLVEEVAGEVQEHSTAAANAQRLFALSNLANASDIDTAYLAGETVRYGAFHQGQEVYAWVPAAAAAIVEGDALESNGDGTLRKVVTDAATDDTQRDSLVAYAREAVDNSGGGSAVRIRIRIA